jgi:long-chain acyl-CoA synthetase
MERVWLQHYESEVPSSLTYPDQTLGQMLLDSAHKFGDRPACHLILRYLGPFALGGRLSYRALADQSTRFASALTALGVKKGDRVALILPNLPQFVIAFYGTLLIGAVVVNTNPQYTARELEFQLADSGAETVVVLSGLYGRLAEAQPKTAVRNVIITDISDYVTGPGIPLVKSSLRKHGLMANVPPAAGIYAFRPLLSAHPEAPPKVAITQEDIALFQYTGGTTGVPKAAMLSHGNMVANTVQTGAWMYTLQPGKERMMGAIPFFHVYGVTVSMCLGIYIAAELVILPTPRPIDNVMKAIHREKATVYPGVPAMYIGIINHPDVGKYDLRSVKACISGAAALPMEVQIRFGEITGGRLVEGYGLTEAAPVTHCNPIYGERRNGSIGLPFPDVDAKIMDYDTFQERQAEEVGELWLRGPQVMQGYWNGDEQTASAITADGWLRTGDIARMDKDGYFYIVDRLKDIIIASGFNIVPREVEEVLYEHPKVQEAVVAGVPDKYRGESVKAFLVLRPGVTATAEEIVEHCRARLAPYKVPKQVEFRAELPKTMVGKFLRRVLVQEELDKIDALQEEAKSGNQSIGRMGPH